MNHIDSVLSHLPCELKWRIVSFVGNPHCFMKLSHDDGNVHHRCAKYHADPSWSCAVENYPAFINVCLYDAERGYHGSDYCGNTRIRTLFLQQWAEPGCDYICGLPKKKMVLKEQHIGYVVKEHEEEVYPSTGEYHLNRLEEIDDVCIEHVVFIPFSQSGLDEF